VRIARPVITCLLFACAAVAARSSDPAAGEMAFDGTMIDSIPPGAVSRDMTAPPWHGNVRPAECCPRCAPPNMFHADACGQCWGSRLHHGCLQNPPLFPRLHALWATGSMPTPRPPSQPRCRQCGAPIEGGF